MRITIFLSLLTLLGSTGCGYHLSNTSFKSNQIQTISLPYIEGDLDGSLTSTLAQSLAASGQWKYVSSDGDLLLKVTLVETKSQEIGYNRSIQNGQVNKWLVPNESRLSSLVKVELIETKTQKTLIGPEYISTSVNYNYDPNFNVDNLVRFSLAQFNFQEIASRIAKEPLNERLSQTIIDTIAYSW